MDTPSLSEYRETHTATHVYVQVYPLFTLSVETLEQRLQSLYTMLITTVRKIEVMVDAINSYVVIAEYYERQYNALAARMRVTLNKHHESIPPTNSSKGGITPP